MSTTVSGTFRTAFTAAGLSLLLSACTWVQLSPEAEQVRVVKADEVGDCVKVGTVTSTGRDSVLGLPRRADKVIPELDDLARKQAVAIDADTLVRLSVEGDTARYNAYNCP